MSKSAEEKARIEEIKNRVEMTSPGQWKTHDAQGCYYVSNAEGTRFAAFDERICEMAYPFAREDRRRADLSFIAHAHQDIPYLLALLEKYEKAVEFGELLAKESERFQIAINEQAEAEEAELEYDIDKLNDCWSAVSSAIYEYRKRAQIAPSSKASP